MTKSDTDGVWQTEVAITPGRHGYKFVIDGDKWMTDPNNNYVESNQFGELNNVVEVA